MNRTSEFRRHQNVVKKQHVKNIVKNIWKDETLANDEKFIGKMTNTTHSYNHCNVKKLKQPKTDLLLKKEKLIQFYLKAENI